MREPAACGRLNQPQGIEAARGGTFFEVTLGVGHPVICFAHITNRMASAEGDFEKGAAAGSIEALRLIQATARRWLAHTPKER